jgi:hypothetical protein
MESPRSHGGLPVCLPLPESFCADDYYGKLKGKLSGLPAPVGYASISQCGDFSLPEGA